MTCNLLPAFLAGAWASILVATFCVLVGYLLRPRGRHVRSRIPLSRKIERQ
jgi:hypothetical protein